jgi:hypothetical protein
MRRSIAFLLLIGCSAPAPQQQTTPEAEWRAQYGVPQDAQTVVIFQQSAHLDIDWQRTFDDYYSTYVENIFLEARQLLGDQSRARYSITEMGYLKHHTDVHPEELDPIKAHIQRGALRIVGGGMTSPDMNLPETETLLRDFLHGARYAEDVLGARVTSAYLPDSFGHAGTTPDVLAAAGFDSVAFARVDGAPTFFEWLNAPDTPFKPGSTALALQQSGDGDFMWRGPGGNKVLGHFMASGLYCTGDNIDYDEMIPLPGDHFGVYYGDDPKFTDGKIDSYVAALKPFAKTPYIFVPVGCDFQHPKTELIGYLDGYNKRQYSKTGVWTVAASFDDYAMLMKLHASAIPEIPAELTPYFMGFYASRPELKRRVREAARPLWAAEELATIDADGGAKVAAELQPVFEKLALTDHHDFVTGTAKDEVASSEQLPLCDAVESMGRAVLAEVVGKIGARIAPAPGAVARLLAVNSAGASRSEVIELQLPLAVDGPVHARAGSRAVPVELVHPRAGRQPAIVRLAVENLPGVAWRAIDLYPGAERNAGSVTLALLDANGQPATGATVARVVLKNARVRAQLDRAPSAATFALTSLTLDGTESIAQASFVVHDYFDNGGLWRLGNEMANCKLEPLPPTALDEQLTVLESSPLFARVQLQTADATREVWLDANSAGLGLALTAAAPTDMTVTGRMRTVSFAFATPQAAPLRTSLAGGYTDRVPQKVYTPTFWPAVAWVSTGNWAVLLRQSTGARLSSDGQVELMTARNVPLGEACDVEGGVGSDTDAHRFEWRIEAAASPAAAESAAQLFNRPIIVLPVQSAASGPFDLPIEQSLAQVSGDGVLSALKPADRGQGVIVRALVEPGPVTITLAPMFHGQVTRTDSSERDLAAAGALAPLTFDRAHDGPIATVRIH